MSPARKPREEKNVPEEKSNEQTSGIGNIEALTQNAPADPPTPAVTKEQEEADKAAALARETQDGKGVDPLPPGDFHSFATEDVEVDSEQDEYLREVASRVLEGRFGSNDSDVRLAINETTDLTATQVFTEVNRRLSAGAASALAKVSVRDVAAQVIRGEWGSDDRTIKQRLEGAGHSYKTVYAEMQKQLGG